jgi:hypothetical protein
MKQQEEDLPEAMKSALRALMLDHMSPAALDVYEIELFEWHVKETEGAWQKMLSSERKYIQDQVDKGAPDVNDSGMLAAEYYARRIRYSHVIYLVSLLESFLDRACSALIAIAAPETRPFGPTELTGNQWEKRLKFLERYGNVKIPGELRSSPEMLIVVRNCLVHENGSTAHVSDGNKRKIRNLPGLNIDGAEFRIEEVYIQHALNGLKALVLYVEDGIGKAIQK